MANYKVNKIVGTYPNNDNIVHKEGCKHYETLFDYEDLGEFSNGSDAIYTAMIKGYRADGCEECIPACSSKLK